MVLCRENIDRQLHKKEIDREQMQSDVEKIKKYDKLRAQARQLRARIAQLRKQHDEVRPSLCAFPASTIPGETSEMYHFYTSQTL